MIEKIYEKPLIYRIHVPIPNNPLKSLNSYVVMNSERPLVIDTGFNRPECKDALLEGLTELGLVPGDCDLFLTHLHSDHSGLAPLFSIAGSKIRMGLVDWVFLARKLGENGWQTVENIYREHGFPEAEIEKQNAGNHARKYAPSNIFIPECMEDQEEFVLGGITFRTILTPGHTPGHMCLYLPEEKILFSGDHVLYTITPNIGIWEEVENSLGDYLESLDKVADMDILRAFPGHREEKDFKGRILALKEHHKERLDELYCLVEKNPDQSAYELASMMKWSVRGRTWDEMSTNQKWFATGEAIAHLIHLEKCGRIRFVLKGSNLVSCVENK